MAKIAIIDDNKEQRETLKIEMRLYLKKRGSALDVIDIFPFASYEEYNPWIIDQEICVLILDERMHNDSEGELGPVGYRGNELVLKIREHFKDIPIFTVTAHIDDEELQARFSEFEYIISRENFDEKYVDIIIRAGQRYLDQNEKELTEFEILTRKIAAGDVDAGDEEKLKALQIKLQMPLMSGLQDRENWLEEYEKQIVSLEQIKHSLQEKLNR
jgi:CheY-like chemotaxis protein